MTGDEPPTDPTEPKSLEDLAQAQGVAPVRSVHELRGTPIDDMSDFLAALRSARGEGAGEWLPGLAVLP